MAPAVHISLNVRDLGRSGDFYRRFFGEPAKLKPDQSKCVTREPEIHLALGPGLDAGTRPGSLSHLGIRVGSTDEVRRWKTDLAAPRPAAEGESRSERSCALQDKFWLTDPDAIRWEVHTVLEDLEKMVTEAAVACCSR